MPTLVLASRSETYDRAFATAARGLGWAVIPGEVATGPAVPSIPSTPVALYAATDLAAHLAQRLDLALLEPPLDCLARVPERFRRRSVEVASFGDLDRLEGRTFVKPADPVDKWFDAGNYSDVRDIRTRGRDFPDAPVILSEPVEWSAEYRCFVHDGRVVASSSYLSFGRPIWKPFGPAAPRVAVPKPGLEVVAGVCAALKGTLPPSFVIDVGLIEERGWSVVEFNPIWCAGLLGADPAAVLPALAAATRPSDALLEQEAQWVVERSAPEPGE